MLHRDRHYPCFMLRGPAKVKDEFKLVFTAHNLIKTWLYLKDSGKALAEM